MKLGIIGYGRMGKMVEQIAKERGHEIVSIIDIGYEKELKKEADCYIDFSIAEVTKEMLPELCKLKIPVVTGTTAWLDKKEEFEKLFVESENRGIWSGNFSLGVNLYWKVLKEAVRIFDNFSEEYDSMIHEFHHKNKIDSPSGTAIRMAEIVLANSSKKETFVTEALERKREDSELHVSSCRGGAVPGTHSLYFDSVFDNIELKHTARSREGFALGSVLAAEKINGIEKGLHDFTDIFDQIFNLKKQ